MHADDLSPMRERLSEFLNARLGGPRAYFERGDRKCIMSAHRPFSIGETERDAWVMCMRRALEDCGVGGIYGRCSTGHSRECARRCVTLS